MISYKMQCKQQKQKQVEKGLLFFYVKKDTLFTLEPKIILPLSVFYTSNQSYECN